MKEVVKNCFANLAKLSLSNSFFGVMANLILLLKNFQTILYTFKHFSRSVPRQQCRQVPYQECHDVPRPVCRKVPHQKCEHFPRHDCVSVPRQHCQNVPNKQCKTVPKEACAQKCENAYWCKVCY